MAVSDVKKIYQDVIADVCSAVREALSEEGYDDHTLQELRTLWLARLENSRALEPLPTSIVDQATNRSYRHPNTGEMNNKQSTEPKIGRLHAASNAAVSNFNTSYITTTNINQGLIPTTSATTTQFIRPNFPNGSTNIGKASNQLDGANDEMICDQNQTTTKKKKKNASKKKSRQIEISFQLDGTGPPLGDDDDDDEDNNSEAEGNDVADDLDDDDDDEGNEEGKEDPNPLCSDDDVSDEDEPAELFDTDNVVVCQYDKISRTKNKWRFVLKSGVMNIDGRDYVFSKATGDADW